MSVNINTNFDGNTPLNEWYPIVKNNEKALAEAVSEQEKALADTKEAANAHKTAGVLDHPDGCVTAEKIANGAVLGKHYWQPLPTGQNLNAIITNGFYYFSDSTLVHAPDGCTRGVLICIHSNGEGLSADHLQIVVDVDHSKIYKRWAHQNGAHSDFDEWEDVAEIIGRVNDVETDIADLKYRDVDIINKVNTNTKDISILKSTPSLNSYTLSDVGSDNFIYVSNKPDSVIPRTYIIKIENDAKHIALLSGDGETELSVCSGDFKEGYTYIIHFVEGNTGNEIIAVIPPEDIAERVSTNESDIADLKYSDEDIIGRVNDVETDIADHKNNPVLDHPDGSVTFNKLDDNLKNRLDEYRDERAVKIEAWNTDLNGIYKSGFYNVRANNSELAKEYNYPEDCMTGALIVTEGSNGFSQIFIDSSVSNNPKMYLRLLDADSVPSTNWKRITVEDDLNKLTKVYTASCITKSNEAAKVVTTTNGDFKLENGAVVNILLSYGIMPLENEITFNIDGTGDVYFRPNAIDGFVKNIYDNNYTIYANSYVPVICVKTSDGDGIDDYVFALLDNVSTKFLDWICYFQDSQRFLTISEIAEGIDSKSDKTTYIYSAETTASITPERNTEYRFSADMVSLTVSLPEDMPEDYAAYIVFTSGETATE
ncbi:MAG: pyocin knob domain-containing protein, partial [Candidatus Ornithomonoglobus sp.]